jgi:hypothetical protein
MHCNSCRHYFCNTMPAVTIRLQLRYGGLDQAGGLECKGWCRVAKRLIAQQLYACTMRAAAQDR